MTSTSLQALTATTGTRHDCWNTPVEFVGDVIQFFGGPVDLDPCSNSEEKDEQNVPANKVYTIKTNGLAHEWVANTVFMNHPYSNSKEWVPYAAHQYECGNARELILLIKLDISTKWWASVSKYPWIAVNKRLKFGNETNGNAAPFQSAIVYLGHRLDLFNDYFGKYGTLYIPYATCKTGTINHQKH